MSAWTIRRGRLVERRRRQRISRADVDRRSAKAARTMMCRYPEDFWAAKVRQRDRRREDLDLADFQIPGALTAAAAELEEGQGRVRWPILWAGVIPERAEGPYPVEWEAVSWLMKAAAGWRCERCGQLGEESEREGPLSVYGERDGLQTDHRDGDPANLDSDNLCVLCADCHNDVHERRNRFGYRAGGTVTG